VFNVKTPERIALLSRLAASVITVAIAFVLIAPYSMAQAAPASQELVQRGAYLARAGDALPAIPRQKDSRSLEGCR